VAFVFFTAMHSGLLAALLSLSEQPWYGMHAERTLAAGVDPVTDQQRAGLLMWIPGGILMTSIGLAFLAAWIGASGRRADRARRRRNQT
jgi:putative membrane protein